MAPSPIPAPLPPWARVLLQLAPLISVGLQEALEHIQEMQSVSAAQPDEWRRFQIVSQLATSTDPADRYVTSIDIVNITGGTIDSSWTDSDYTVVLNQLSLLVGAYLPIAPASLKFVEYRAYRMMFNDLSIAAPHPPSGPPERTFADSRVGTIAGNVPAPQVALSTTDKTAYPRHWGRNYWPCPAANLVDNTGHFGTTPLDAFGDSMRNVYENLMEAEFFPVVVMTQAQGAPARGLLTIDQLQIDNVPDVVRRRRPKTTTHRYVGGLP